MKISEAYPSKYLTAEDLNGKSVAVKIEAVNLEEIGKGSDKDSKLVIDFVGKEKALVCNKTNAKTISKVLGSEESDDWIGKSIIIEPREVEFQGNMVWSIRVSLRRPGSASPASAPLVPADDDGYGDDPNMS